MKLKGKRVSKKLLLAVVLVSLAGLAGWMAWQAKQKADLAAQVKEQAAEQSKAQAGSASPGSYFNLEEFGSRIPRGDVINGLTLATPTASQFNGQDRSVPILAPELDGGWKCPADAAANYKGTIGTISITTQDKRSGPGDPVSAKKIGKYTFGYEPAGANCTDSPMYKELQDYFKKQFEQIEPFEL